MPLNAIEMNNANAKRRWNGQIGGVRERHTSDRNLFIGKIGPNHRFILNSVSARCLCFNCYNNLIIDYKTKNKAIFIQFSGISKETYHVHIQHKKTRHHNRPPNSQKLQHSNVLAQFPFTVIEICIFNMTINTLFFLPNFKLKRPQMGIQFSIGHKL